MIHCENCGEEYSSTYKRCPFCDERPGRTGIGGRRLAKDGLIGRFHPIQIVGWSISAALIVAALVIVFKWVSPFFSKKPPDNSSGSDSSQSSVLPNGSGSGSQTELPGSSGSGTLDNPGGSSALPSVPVTSIKLNRNDITLTSGEVYQFTATVTPEGVSEPVVWTSSNEALATVDSYGNVTNVNKSGSKQKVIITASCGGQSASSDVYCSSGSGGGSSTTQNPGGSTNTTTPAGPVSANSKGTVTSSSLNVRAEASTSGEKVGSLKNGDVVTILEDTGKGWYKINFKDINGYVSSDYIKVNG